MSERWGDRVRSLIHGRRRPLLASTAITLVILTVICLGYVIRLGYVIPWTGFGSYTTPRGEYRRYKTLWDWMELFVIPAVLAIGAAWFNQRREKLTRELDGKRRDEERELEQDRLHEERLQRYLDNISVLMLEKGLRTSEPDSEVRDVARARTLTVFRGLDGKRKGILLRFLYESELLASGKGIDLSEADLSGADLRQAKLGGANLSGAYLGRAYLGGAYLGEADLGGAYLGEAELRHAKLGGADLGGANFWRADLSGADLGGADLGGADLWRANLSKANLSAADLGGADLRAADLTEAHLDGADFSKANLSAADLGGADLTEAHLDGADLGGARNLTQTQVGTAHGDGETRLPEGLLRPESWESAAAK